MKRSPSRRVRCDGVLCVISRRSEKPSPVAPIKRPYGTDPLATHSWVRQPPDQATFITSLRDGPRSYPFPGNKLPGTFRLRGTRGFSPGAMVYNPPRRVKSERSPGRRVFGPGLQSLTLRPHASAIHRRHHLGRISFAGDPQLGEGLICLLQISIRQLHSERSHIVFQVLHPFRAGNRNRIVALS